MKNAENKKTYISRMTEVSHFDQYVIKIAPSLLKNKMHSYEKEMRRLFRISTSFLGLLSMISILVTSEKYKTILGISGDVWNAVFLVAFLVFLLNLVFNLILFSIEWWKNKRIISVGNFINELVSKEGGEET